MVASGALFIQIQQSKVYLDYQRHAMQFLYVCFKHYNNFYKLHWNISRMNEPQLNT